jgi:O-antigen ligase
VMEAELTRGRVATAAIPLAVGSCLGFLVAWDPYATQALQMHLRIPFIVLGALSALVTLGTVVVMYGNRAFAKREMVLITMLVCAPACMRTALSGVDGSQLLLIVAAPTFLLLLVVEQRRLQHWPIIEMLLLWMAIALIASGIHGGMGSLIGSKALFAKIIFFSLLVNLIITRERLHFAIRLMILTAVFNGFIAIAQEISYHVNPKQTIQELKELGDSRAFEVIKSTPWGTMYRSNGLFSHYRNLGHYLLLSLALLSLGPFSNKLRYLALIPIVVGLWTTVSFGQYLNAGILCLMLPYFRRPSRSIHYTWALLVLLCIAYFSGAFSWAAESIFGDIGEKSGSDRIEIFWMGLDAFARYPMLGIGVKNIGRLSVFPEGWPVHNAFMQMMSETGLLGGLSFIALWGFIFARIALLAAAAQDKTDKLLARGLVLGYVIMTLDFMVEPFADNISCWLYMGITASMINIYRQRMQRSLGTDGKNEY